MFKIFTWLAYRKSEMLNFSLFLSLPLLRVPTNDNGTENSGISYSGTVVISGKI